MADVDAAIVNERLNHGFMTLLQAVNQTTTNTVVTGNEPKPIDRTKMEDTTLDDNGDIAEQCTKSSAVHYNCCCNWNRCLELRENILEHAPAGHPWRGPPMRQKSGGKKQAVLCYAIRRHLKVSNRDAERLCIFPHHWTEAIFNLDESKNKKNRSTFLTLEEAESLDKNDGDRKRYAHNANSIRTIASKLSSHTFTEQDLLKFVQAPDNTVVEIESCLRQWSGAGRKPSQRHDKLPPTDAQPAPEPLNEKLPPTDVQPAPEPLNEKLPPPKDVDGVPEPPEINTAMNEQHSEPASSELDQTSRNADQKVDDLGVAAPPAKRQKQCTDPEPLFKEIVEKTIRYLEERLLIDGWNDVEGVKDRHIITSVNILKSCRPSRKYFTFANQNKRRYLYICPNLGDDCLLFATRIRELSTEVFCECCFTRNANYKKREQRRKAALASNISYTSASSNVAFSRLTAPELEERLRNIANARGLLQKK